MFLSHLGSLDFALVPQQIKFYYSLSTRSEISLPSRFTLAALDIKKAFDCVHQGLLIEKLTQRFNFEQSAANFVKDYLTGRSQVMKANGTFSKLQQILTGVPQGSVLGPLLFIMFINDLTLHENCYLFADDCLLITHGKTLSISTAEMESLIISASHWYTGNKLVLNVSKIDVMKVSKNA
mgnify:FL=1